MRRRLAIGYLSISLRPAVTSLSQTADLKTPNQISELQELCHEAYSQNFADHWNDNGLALYLEQEFGNERVVGDLQDPSTDYYFMVFVIPLRKH